MSYIIMRQGKHWFVARRNAGSEDEYGMVCRCDTEWAARDICEALNKRVRG